MTFLAFDGKYLVADKYSSCSISPGPIDSSFIDVPFNTITKFVPVTGGKMGDHNIRFILGCGIVTNLYQFVQFLNLGGSINDLLKSDACLPSDVALGFKEDLTIMVVTDNPKTVGLMTRGDGVCKLTEHHRVHVGSGEVKVDTVNWFLPGTEYLSALEAHTVASAYMREVSRNYDVYDVATGAITEDVVLSPTVRQGILSRIQKRLKIYDRNEESGYANKL